MGPQEEYIETVFTCEGDYNDPHLRDRLEDFQRGLKELLLTDKKKLILKKVEPWNSVRVTVNIPRDAAFRLKQLAQQGNARLRELGISAVQIEGDQLISLTVAGRNNEKTQLVFRTANSSASAPSVPVFDTRSPNVDDLGTETGPSNVEATRKNIQEYLRQGNTSIFDSLFGQTSGESDIFRAPNAISTTCDSLTFKPNNILASSTTSNTSQLSTSQCNLPPGHIVGGFSNNPSPNQNSNSPSRSPGAHGTWKFPMHPGIPPGLPPDLAERLNMGRDNPMMDFPPPPPYPQGSSLMNNIQKSLTGASTATSPLLVNLLKNDPAMARLFGQKFPPNLDPGSQPPPKKKRKPRKPKDKSKKLPQVPSSEGELPIQSVPNPALSTSTTTAAVGTSTMSSTGTSVPMVTQSLPASGAVATFANQGRSIPGLNGPGSSEQLAVSLIPSNAQIMASISGQSHDIRRPGFELPSPNQRKSDQDGLFLPENTAGKMVNPYTGLLEPVDNSSSDTSPTKSDVGEKASPRSSALPHRKQSPGADSLSDIPSMGHSRLDRDSMNRLQGEHSKITPIHSSANVSRFPPGCRDVSSSAAAHHPGISQTVTNRSVESSQSGFYSSNFGHQHVQRQQEHMGTNSTILSKRSESVSEHSVQSSVVSVHQQTKVSTVVSGRSAEHRPVTSMSHGGLHVDNVNNQKPRTPQGTNFPSKPFPQQLLNKPLQQVKQNSVGSSPSGASPDGKGHSDGDSEGSSHSINTPEAHLGAEPVLAPHAAQVDANLKAYNNDSGVGSSSERSDDTPSEPGDNDFKTGHTNTVEECAKNQLLNSIPKQLPQIKHDSNIMTVGYATSGNNPIKNDADLAAYLAIHNKYLNSKLDRNKVQNEKLASEQNQTAQHWSAKEATRSANNADRSSSPRVAQENRKSPKLAPSPRSYTGTTPPAHEIPTSNAMQGNPERTMHKKKSPRNSPRGSPRNSPRNSPRTFDMGSQGQARQTCVTAQEFAAQLPSPAGDPLRPPYSAHSVPSVGVPKISAACSVPSSVEAQRDIHGHIAENARILPHVENPLFMKHLEGYASLHHLQNIAAIGAGMDPLLLHKLGPLFAQFQQQLQTPTSVGANEGRSRSPRSPVGSLGKPASAMGPSISVPDINSIVDSEYLQNSQTLPANVTSLPQNSLDRESGISVNHSGGKGNTVAVSKSATTLGPDGQKGTNITSLYSRRSSPAGSMINSLPFPVLDSSLPLPKKLTESVQRLVKPLAPIDNSLPHPNRRSPGNSSTPSSKTGPAVTVSPTSSVTKDSGGKNGDISSRQQNSSRKSPVSSSDPNNVTMNTDFENLPDLALSLHNSDFQPSRQASSSFSVSSVSSSFPLPCSYVSVSQVASISTGIPMASTSLVPAVTGSIFSSTTNSAHSSVMNPSHSFPNFGPSPAHPIVRHAGADSSPPSLISNVPPLCNKDGKMAASLSALDSSSKTTVSVPTNVLKTAGSASPVQTGFHSTSARYPVPKTSDKPKSPFQPMGLSEMLQETANLHSISVSRSSSPHTVRSNSPRVPVRYSNQGFSVEEKRTVHSADNQTQIQNVSRGGTNVMGTGLYTVSSTKTTLSNRDSSTELGKDPQPVHEKPVVSRTAFKMAVPSEPPNSEQGEVKNSSAGICAKVSGVPVGVPCATDVGNSSNTQSGTANAVCSQVSTVVKIESSEREHNSGGFKPVTGDSKTAKENCDTHKTSHVGVGNIGEFSKGHNMESFHGQHIPQSSSTVIDRNVLSDGNRDSLNQGMESHGTNVKTENVASSVGQEKPPTSSAKETCSAKRDEKEIEKSKESRSCDTGVHCASGEINCMENNVENMTHGSGNMCQLDIGSNSEGHHNLRPKNTKKRRGSLDSLDETLSQKSGSAEPEAAPMQLRSRKRTNTGDSENSNEDQVCKKQKLDSIDSVKVDRDSKLGQLNKPLGQTNAHLESKLGTEVTKGNGGGDGSATLIDTVKSGLRARTNSKNVPVEEKTSKMSTRESRKDSKTVSGKIPEKKLEPPKVVEEKKSLAVSRRNRQSPSAPPDKLVNSTGTREKSPVRGRTRGRNSPSVVDQQETETQENKRTTRSAKSKAEVAAVPETVPANKRRRASRDHR